MAPAALPHALSLLLIALVLDALLAWLPGFGDVLRAPVAGTARLAGWLDARLNRRRRSAGTRFARGLLVTLMIAVLALVVGTVIKAGAMQARPAGVVDVIALLFLLSQRHAFDRARRAARNMAADDHAAARRAVEELAVSLGAGVLGVTFWYLVLGLPGLFVYGAVHAVAWRIGRGGGAFGRPAAGLDALLGIVPAVVAGWLIALAALFAPRGRPLAALGTMARARAKLPLWDAGGVTAAMAGALGFALGDGPWIGDGRARLVPQDVRNAAYLYAVACLIHMGAVAGALFALYSPI